MNIIKRSIKFTGILEPKRRLPTSDIKISWQTLKDAITKGEFAVNITS